MQSTKLIAVMAALLSTVFTIQLATAVLAPQNHLMPVVFAVALALTWELAKYGFLIEGLRDSGWRSRAALGCAAILIAGSIYASVAYLNLATEGNTVPEETRERIRAEHVIWETAATTLQAQIAALTEAQEADLAGDFRTRATRTGHELAKLRAEYASLQATKPELPLVQPKLALSTGAEHAVIAVVLELIAVVATILAAAAPASMAQAVPRGTIKKVTEDDPVAHMAKLVREENITPTTRAIRRHFHVGSGKAARVLALVKEG